VGTLKISGDLRKPDPRMQQMTGEMMTMGQTLINPPSVEGWHQGTEWINTGSSMDRVNFSAKAIGDITRPGVNEMIGKVMAEAGGKASPRDLVERCLDQMGAVTVSDNTRKALVNFAAKTQGAGGAQPNGGLDEKRVAGILEMIAASPDYQRG